jgi:glycosyltransferase involved in cell wall biosynthesis
VGRACDFATELGSNRANSVRILFVTGGVPSLIVQAHVLDLIRVLSRSHQLSVICFDMGSSLEAGSKDELGKIADLKCIPLPRKNLAVRAIRSLFSFAPAAVQGFYSDEMKDAILDAMRETQFDLVMFEQLVIAQYGGFASGTVSLLFPVDAVSRLKWQRFCVALNPARKLAFLLDYVITKRYEKRIYSQFDGVLFVSEADVAYVLANDQVDPSKAFVLPLAVDANYFFPCESKIPQEPSVVFLGNMFNYINEDAILWFSRNVWIRLKTEMPNLKLYIVGNQPTERVRVLAQTDPNIIVTGFLNDVRPIIWNAAIFISPLRMGAGVKNRILQALAMGKAIVASPATVDGVGVTDGRQVLIAQNEIEWFSKCLALLRDDRERERLGKEARQYVEQKFSLEAKATTFMEIARRVKDLRNAI